MLVYTKKITARLEYTISFFSSLLSIDPWRITNDRHAFIVSNDSKINYSEEYIHVNSLQIHPHTLLFETNVHEQDINCTNKNGSTIFFQTKGFLGFDVFAASFYLLSRYEEYLLFEEDGYGRYDYKQALAYKGGFLQTPLINYWADAIKKQTANLFPEVKWRVLKFLFQPTYDIDMAWSYKNKGLLRNTGGLAKDFLFGSFHKVKDRIRVLRGKSIDPFYHFNWLYQLHEIYGIYPWYFFLVATKRSVYDKNISPYCKQMRQLIAAHSTHENRNSIGLHPSWQTNNNNICLKEEKAILTTIIKQPVSASRQHYLKLRLPDTYRNLINAGIQQDYTMGYSAINGFRASVATPFFWYDLKKDETTSLQVFPFCYMDATSVFYKKDTPLEALAELEYLMHEVKKVNGYFSMIWHNDTFACVEWKDVYVRLLQLGTIMAT